jgi:C4-dicarboxylate-specific signal transduction histidine kinase
LRLTLCKRFTSKENFAFQRWQPKAPNPPNRAVRSPGRGIIPGKEKLYVESTAKASGLLADLGFAQVKEERETMKQKTITAEIRADRAEAELRKLQARLAHVSRVTTLGELTASLAHEVSQPLAGVVSSADACLHWLAAQPPNVDKARRATERIMRDAKRASDGVARVRNLAKKTPLQRTWVDINETVEETISLAARELTQNNVSLEMQLANNLPRIWADRIQLQQVILNLLINAP